MSKATRAWLRGASTVIDVKGHRPRGGTHALKDPVGAAWEMVGSSMRSASREVQGRPVKRAR